MVAKGYVGWWLMIIQDHSEGIEMVPSTGANVCQHPWVLFCLEPSLFLCLTANGNVKKNTLPMILGGILLSGEGIALFCMQYLNTEKSCINYTQYVEMPNQDRRLWVKD
ncbi:hypothetical protein DFH07DRAFT_765360 [Mycena maculata]|uniref:Uncharacterized protein n=1 Tax=Mycena maculata TaxID=230809 RepID=A0AAD7NY53_9AGAR|nr:hypothetical protein DFH07DRAFT_765360 [Mycena maculata]